MRTMKTTNKWHGVLLLKELLHLSKEGEVILRINDRKNILNLQGEDYILRLMFNGEAMYTTYYFGLDSRSSLSTNQNLSDLNGLEPASSTGYQRAAILSTSFSEPLFEDGYFQSIPPEVTFIATSNWNYAIKNIFMTNSPTNNYSGNLICSIGLQTTINLTAGQSIALKFAMAFCYN